MELLNWSEVADFFRISRDLPKAKRETKIKNWLKHGVLPRSVTTKIGRDVLFIRHELENFALQKQMMA